MKTSCAIRGTSGSSTPRSASPLPALQSALKLEGLYGKAGSSFSLRTDSLIKRITYLAPTVSYQLGSDTVAEVGMRISLAGRNFPAGNQVIVGLSTRIDPLFDSSNGPLNGPAGRRSSAPSRGRD